VLFRYAVQVFSEGFWNGSSCPYYYWRHLCFTFRMSRISIIRVLLLLLLLSLLLLISATSLLTIVL
jgi:hypothetical protein